MKLTSLITDVTERERERERERESFYEYESLFVLVSTFSKLKVCV